jgi:DNA-binding response OmpR family regulator
VSWNAVALHAANWRGQGVPKRVNKTVQNTKVLIVDDEADVIQALKLRLETAGYDAVTASDGAEALKILDNTEVGLILADLMMPNLDGLELTRRIRQNHRWRLIQVLLFSCHDDPVARCLALEFGASDYLPKTLGARAIVSRVNEILAGDASFEVATRPAPRYKEAELDLVNQLRAISPSTAGTPPLGDEAPDPTAGDLESAGRGSEVDLQNLALALQDCAKVSPTRPG